MDQYAGLAVPVVYPTEATGIYYEQLAWYLHAIGCTVSVILPNKAKQYKKSLGLKSKTDRIGAKELAQMSCEQSHQRWHPVSDNLYILRLITRNIQSISDQFAIVKNQLHALAHGMFRDKEVEKMYAAQVKLLEKNKAALRGRVEQIISGDEVLKGRFDKILKLKGLGPAKPGHHRGGDGRLCQL